MAELVDAPDLGSGDESRGGSSPSARTISLAAGQARRISVEREAPGQVTIGRWRIIGLGRPLAMDDKAECKMQVTETLSQGLKREYDISLPASDLAEKLNGQLAELKAKVRINGFRPGKVPVEHLRKVYGKSVMADVVQEAIAEREQEDRRRQRPAPRPRAEGRAADRSGRDRRGPGGARRPQLQDRARGAAGVRSRRFLRNRARASGRRRRAGRRRGRDRPARGGAPHLCR